MEEDQFKSSLYCGEHAFTRSHWIMFMPSLSMTLMLDIVILLFSLDDIMWLVLILVVCAAVTVDRLLITCFAEYFIYKNKICAAHYRFFGICTDGFALDNIDEISVKAMNVRFDCGDVVIKTKDGKNHVLWSVIAPEEFVNTCIQNINYKTKYYEYRK